MDATDFFKIKNGQMENTNHHILTFLTFFLYPSLAFEYHHAVAEKIIIRILIRT